MSSHGSGWEVSGELCSYGSIVSMWLYDSAPDDSESGVSDGVLALEDVGDSLSKVESSILLIDDTLDFQQCELFMLSALASLEASENSLSVESIKRILRRDYGSLT